MRLEGKVAIVTGTASGMGKAIAIAFAKEGAKVTGGDLNEEGARETAKIIEEAGGEAYALKVDTKSWVDVDQMVSETVNRFGKLDILVNNAGAFRPNLRFDAGCEEEDWNEVIGTDLKGYWYGMKRAIPEMLKVGKGKIINMASLAAFMGTSGMMLYCTAKAGVVGLSRVVAIDYGVDNICVNCIWPEFANKISGVTPLQRWSKPEEIAPLAVYLASDESDFMTGSSIIIDGGLYAGMSPLGLL
jgi:NAD(P)-dependent dehydrogenase (short-subunit alcohol dehydrogenase family)